MADKEFQVRHGLIVNNTVLVANSITNNVGIGRANPGYALDVVGTANASNLLINGNPVSLASATDAAFNKANAALANATGTFAGDLTVTGNVFINGNQGVTVRGSDVGLYYDSISAGALELAHTNDASGNYFEFLTTDGASQLRITTAGNNIVMLPGQNLGVGTSTPAVKLDVEGRANVSTALTVAGMNVVPTIEAAFAKANSVSSDADEKANAAIVTANLAFDKANSANILAFNTGTGANAFAAGVGSNANLFTSATIAGANTAVGTGANAFATSATVAANNYAGIMANAANNWANTKLSNGTVTLAGALTTTGQIFANAQVTISATDGGSEGGELSLRGASSYDTKSIDSFNDNVRIFTVSTNNNILKVFNAGGGTFGLDVQTYAIVNGMNLVPTIEAAYNQANTGGSSAAFDKANSANIVASNAYDKANAANVLAFNTGLGANAYASGVGSNANLFASATIAGANAAVGTGANAFATAATVAANNYAGVMANATNAFTSSTIAGANLAVGTGANVFTTAATIAANNYAGIMANAANAFMISTVSGANTIASSAFDKANAANVLAFNTGIGANAFTSIAFDAANAAFAQANSVSSDADEKANAAIITANLAFDKANSANIVASNAYDKANAANVLAFNALPNTTATFNGTLTVNNDIIVRGNATLGDANTDTITINGNSITLGNNQNIDAGTLFIDAVNNRVGINTTSLTTSVTAGLEIRKQGAGWYHNSTSHGGLYTEFTTPAGGGSIFTIRTDNGGPQLRLITSGNSIVMLPATGFVGIGATLPTSNLHVIGNTNITSSLIVATINVIPAIASAYDQANAANLLAFNTGIGANAYASGVGSNANLFASATIAGANTAVGAGANAFTSATIAGANAAVGTGANTFATVATIAANNYAGVMANAANAYADTKLANTSGATFQGNLNVTGNLVANTLVSNAGFIDLGPGSRPANVEGRIYYDNIDKVLTVVNESNFKISVGQTEYARVYNDSGSTLLKGQAVYATGFHTTTHHHFTVDLADASDPNKYDVIGLVAADIPNAEHGYVIVRGWLGGINTSSLTAGTRFHLGYATPGSLVTVSPEYPNYPYDIGYCIVANNTNGYLYVDRQTHTIEALRVINSARVGGDMTVEGNFTVLGSENAITVNSLEVGTQFIYLGSGDSIPNSAVYFVGSGLNDIDFQGHYTGNANTSYYVMVSDVSPDKFSWGYNSDFSNLVQANVVMQYQTAQALSNGISVYFNANTGHTVGDKWNATAFGVSTDFGIVGNHIDGPNGYTHAGLFRDATDGTFKFFRSYNPEVNGNIDIANTSFALANVQVNRITAAEVYEGGSQISSAIAGAYVAANGAFDKANSANVLAFNTGVGANAYSSGVGSNANLFASATIAGANTAVGTGANAFATSATIAANNYAGVMSNAANSFASATIVGANAAVGAGANSVGVAAFARANASINVINIGGTITLTSNSTQINVVASNGVTLAANNFAGIARLNIGLSTTGVTASTYGNSTTIPVFTVDAYGRITSASNVATVGGGAKVNVGSTTPTNNTQGDLWWNSDAGRLLLYYDDGSSAQWVEASPEGAVGPQGLTGNTGNAGNVEIGTITTGAPATSATVTNSGNGSYAVLNFTIPRGNVGNAGNVAVGTVATGVPGSSATVTNSGNGSFAILDFSIPRGSNVAANSTTTLNAGVPAYVTNSGNNNYFKLDFGIPQGANVVANSTTTLVPGSLASVTNSGNNNYLKLDFGIPQGANIVANSTTTAIPGTLASVTNSGNNNYLKLDFSIPRGNVGNTGQTGDKAGLKYTYETITSNSDPGIKKVKYNNALAIFASELYINESSWSGDFVSSVFNFWKTSSQTNKGILTITDNSASTNNFDAFTVTDIFEVSGPPAYYVFKIDYVGAGGGGFANGADVVLNFSPSGNVGPTGPTGNTGNTGNSAPRSVTIESPVAGDKIPLFFTDYNININVIKSVLIGNTSPSANFSIRYGNSIAQVGTEVIASGIVVSNTTNGQSNTTFTNSQIPANNFVWINISSTLDTVDYLHVTII